MSYEAGSRAFNTLKSLFLSLSLALPAASVVLGAAGLVAACGDSGTAWQDVGPGTDSRTDGGVGDGPVTLPDGARGTRPIPTRYGLMATRVPPEADHANHGNKGQYLRPRHDAFHPSNSPSY